MTLKAPDPVLLAILSAAVEATGAEEGLVLALEGEVLRVAAATGAVDIIGQRISARAGVAGYVVASGQPLVLTADSGDPRLGEGTASLLGHNPAAVLCVPCEYEQDMIGVVELLDRDGSFTVDDTNTIMRLADIAAAALVADRGSERMVADPGDLAADLRHLATTDPGRYASVAGVIQVLLANG